MKDGLSSFLKFAGGTAFGATLGATIGLLMAPKSGEEMQAETAAYLKYVRDEGERARQEAENEVANRFRQKVNDPETLKAFS